MSNPTPAPVPMDKTKHAIVIALLTAAGAFLTSLVTGGVIAAPIGSAIGALIGEGLIYEHSS